MTPENPTFYYNAHIHSPHEATVQNWLLCSAGRIVAMGPRNDHPRLTEKQITKIDLHGGHVYPAFTDAHTHLFMSALNAGLIDLRSAGSLAEALHILQQYAKKTPTGRWVKGYGFDKNLWNDGQPHKKYLDQLFPAHPVLLESKDCHSIWVNSLALKMAGIHNDHKNPAGGRLERDARGKLNGLLYEQALPLIQRQVPPPDDAQMKRAVKDLIKEFHQYGITSAHTMEGLKEYRLLQQLQKAGELNLRISIYIPHQEAGHLIENHLHSGFGDHWLRLGGIKIFADGSLGSRTADMRDPYENEPRNFGLAHHSEAELNEIIAMATRNGLSPAVHAIGDAAVLKTLHALKNNISWKQKWRLIFRIEHAQLLSGEALSLFRQTQTIASVQPVHIADDVRKAERYWGKRSANAYALNDLARSGVTLCFGSDTPVADFNPFKGIFSAVHRRYHLQMKEAPWHAQQALPLAQAWWAYTLGGAQASGEMHLKGSLKTGNLADFIVLDSALNELSPAELLAARIRLTILNGTIVYRRP